jgi:hypothetical protein
LKDWHKDEEKGIERQRERQRERKKELCTKKQRPTSIGKEIEKTRTEICREREKQKEKDKEREKRERERERESVFLTPFNALRMRKKTRDKA